MRMAPWITVLRDAGKLLWYEKNNVARSAESLVHLVVGDELMVYVGAFGGADARLGRQVVLASEQPTTGIHQETFELVFRGPREMAIEIFEAHVGMLP